MTQALFSFAPPKAPPAQTEQQQNLERVSGRIAPLVVEFCTAHIGRKFRASELARFVMDRAGGAAGSPDRILRDLRAKGVVSYTNVSRSGSEYLVTAVRP